MMTKEEENAQRREEEQLKYMVNQCFDGLSLEVTTSFPFSAGYFIFACISFANHVV